MSRIIYLINKNNEPFYIGKTNNPNRRLNSHKRKFNDNNIEMIELEEVYEDTWKEREQYWIRDYELQGFQLYNTHKGGNGRPEGGVSMESIIKHFMIMVKGWHPYWDIKYTIQPNFISKMKTHYDSYENKQQAYFGTMIKLTEIWEKNVLQNPKFFRG